MVAQAADNGLREPGQDVVADPRPHGTHGRDVLGEKSAGDERQDLGRALIEPLGVLDDADERLLVGHVGEQGSSPAR